MSGAGGAALAANASISSAVSRGFSTLGEWPAPSTVSTRTPGSAA